MRFLDVTEIEIRLNDPTAPVTDTRIVAWASFVLGGLLKIRDAAIIRDPEGILFLKWPQIRRPGAKAVGVVYPIHRPFAQAVERAVLERLPPASQISGPSGRPGNNGPKTLSTTGD